MTRMLRTAVLLLGLLITRGAAADVFRILDDPKEAAQARVDLFQQARGEIDAIYFLARNDRITLAALALLCDARRRGVGTVRLVVDANFQHIPKAVLAHLRDEGVEVRVYHPLTVRHPSWMFRRMHEKVVITDAERYIAGGRNLAEDYFGLAKRNFVDRDVYVEGESAAEAQRHFERLWSSSHVAELHVRVSDDAKRRAADALWAALHDLECSGFIALNTGHDWSADQNDAAPVRFLHDPPAGAEWVGRDLAQILGQAKKSIVLESPYLVPSRDLLELLERKLAEGVYVLIVTNSLRSSDGVIAHAGYLKYKRRVLRAGIDVREYKGPDTLHAKSAVVDGRIAVIGSYNLDPRSENLNTEVMAVAEDVAAARALQESIEMHVQNAWAARSGPPRQWIPRSRAFKAWAAKFLLPIVENQL